MSKKDKTFDEIIEETIEEAPELPEYIIAELAEITDEKCVSSQWHVEILESRDVVEHLEQGREKLRQLKNEKR